MSYSEGAPKGLRQTVDALRRKMTPHLFMVCFITAMLNMLFGFDTTSFSGVQSIPAFERQFGTPTSSGGYELSSSRASFMSSVAFAGKFFGTLVRLTLCLSVIDCPWITHVSYLFYCRGYLRSMDIWQQRFHADSAFLHRISRSSIHYVDSVRHQFRRNHHRVYCASSCTVRSRSNYCLLQVCKLSENLVSVTSLTYYTSVGLAENTSTYVSFPIFMVSKSVLNFRRSR